MSKQALLCKGRWKNNLSKRLIKQNCNQPPSRNQFIRSHKPIPFIAVRQELTSLQERWLLSLPQEAHAAGPTFYEHIPTLLWKAELQDINLQRPNLKGSLTSGISMLLNNNWDLKHIAYVLPRPQAPLQSPVDSIMPLIVPNKASLVSVWEKKPIRNTIFRQMSKQFSLPRDSLPDCPAGFVILRAQQNSIRINSVIR